MHPATSQTNQNTTVSTPARLIRACVSTLEYPILGLIASCVVVECVILLATQQYEAATAPIGSVLVLGMSAGGMVVFFAELLKLPVAWASGALTGWTRLIFNIVAAGLCLLTATTVKDIVTREWDMALAPSRVTAGAAREARAEIAALQQAHAETVTSTDAANQLWTAKIEATNAELVSLEENKTAEQARYIERLNALKLGSIDPLIQVQIEALEKIQREEAAAVAGGITELNDQLVALRLSIIQEGAGRSEDFAKLVAATKEERRRVQEQNDADAKRADEALDADTKQFNTAFEAYRRIKAEHADAHARVDAALAVELNELRKNDGVLFGLEGKEKAARARADVEKKRLDDLFKKVTEPKPPTRRVPSPLPLPVLPSPPATAGEAGVDVRITALEARIDSASKDRDRVGRDRAVEIKTLLTEAKKNSVVNTTDSATRRNALDTEFSARDKQLDEHMSTLLTQRKEQEDQLTDALNPAEATRKRQEIPAQIKRLKGEAEKAETEAKRLRTDTNAIRAASGMVRWFMPDASEDRLEEIAYGVYPVGIAILVSFLPALLLELGVHSLIAPPATRERSQWNLIHRFSRHRRALIRERGIAAAKLRRAEHEQATYENARAQCERDAEALKTKTEEDSTARIDLQAQQRIAFETEVRLRTEALDQEIEARATALHQELVAARDQAILDRDEARNASNAQVAELLTQKAQAVDRVTTLTDTLLKQHADIELLSRRVIQLDARGPIPPTLVE